MNMNNNILLIPVVIFTIFLIILPFFYPDNGSVDRTLENIILLENFDASVRHSIVMALRQEYPLYRLSPAKQEDDLLNIYNYRSPLYLLNPAYPVSPSWQSILPMGGK